MKALLDTHTFLWWNLNDPQLSNTAREIIQDGRNQIFVSAVTAWEIAIKVSKGRLLLPEDLGSYFANRMMHYSLSALPILISHALHVFDLPVIHEDPFDRLLVAQSKIEELPILTADDKIGRYDVEVIW